MDTYVIIRNMFVPVLLFIRNFFFITVGAAFLSLVLFILFFFVWYKINLFKVRPFYLALLKIRFKPYNLLRWLLWDFLTRKSRANQFRPYGFSIFVGPQGSGKTISMIEYLREQKEKYPNCKIVTNFYCSFADKRMTDWRDLLEYRNHTDGVIFAIDEIHSEYSSASWKDFPESILSEISQQRKQRIKIVATAQVFARVAKPIREQAFSVICCNTYLGRFTTNREYDAAEYGTSDTPYQVKKKCRPIWKSRFVQSNDLRRCYDTYEKIERMQKIEFIPRGERH
jgi:hypothetical protein